MCMHACGTVHGCIEMKLCMSQWAERKLLQDAMGKELV